MSKLLDSMKTFKCEKCNTSVNFFKCKENIFKCACYETRLYITPILMEFDFKDYLFTIEKDSEKDPYHLRAHQISVEAEYGEPLFSSHDENQIVKGINDFLTNSIFN